MSPRAASARCMPADPRPVGTNDGTSYRSSIFSYVTSLCRRHEAAQKTGRPHSGAGRGTRARWTHDQLDSRAVLPERMLYTRDHSTGQMTVASVPGETIPLLPSFTFPYATHRLPAPAMSVFCSVADTDQEKVRLSWSICVRENCQAAFSSTLGRFQGLESRLGRNPTAGRGKPRGLPLKDIFAAIWAVPLLTPLLREGRIGPPRSGFVLRLGSARPTRPGVRSCSASALRIQDPANHAVLAHGKAPSRWVRFVDHEQDGAECASWTHPRRQATTPRFSAGEVQDAGARW
jgi:hypothetical protein